MLKTIIFGAGGTAGHVFMARGIAHYYKGYKVLITDLRGVKYVCDCKNCNYKGGKEECNSCPFDKVEIMPISSGRPSFKLIWSFFKCLRVLFRYRDCIFFGCGAYVSFIPGVAAILLRREVQLYQGDQIPGLANRLLQYFAARSWVSSDNIQLKNSKPVGCVPRHYMRREAMKNEGEFRLLIAGSSVGSSLLYGLMPSAVTMLTEETRKALKIVHQAKKQHQEYLSYMYDRAGVSYELSEFFDNREELPKAHFVICRAGWSLISDVIATGRAALFVPWEGAKDNHQYHNAIWVSPDKHWILEESECSAEKIAGIIESLSKDMFAKNEGLRFIIRGDLFARSAYHEFRYDGGKMIAESLMGIKKPQLSRKTFIVHQSVPSPRRVPKRYNS